MPSPRFFFSLSLLLCIYEPWKQVCRPVLADCKWCGEGQGEELAVENVYRSFTVGLSVCTEWQESVINMPTQDVASRGPRRSEWDFGWLYECFRCLLTNVKPGCSCLCPTARSLSWGCSYQALHLYIFILSFFVLISSVNSSRIKIWSFKYVFLGMCSNVVFAKPSLSGRVYVCGTRSKFKPASCCQTWENCLFKSCHHLNDLHFFFSSAGLTLAWAPATLIGAFCI